MKPFENLLAALIPCADGTQADPSLGCVKTPPSILNPQSNLVDWILKIASGLSVAVGLAAIIGCIVSGIQYTTAAGDEEKIQRAKRTLFWSLVGVVVAGLAYAVTAMLGDWLIK